MQEVEDLFPEEIAKWLLEQLRLYRLSKSNGFLRINILDGHISTYGQYIGKKHVKKPKKLS